VVVASPYDGRSQSGCGGGGCKINAAAARARARTLQPAQAFATVARDIPEWFLKAQGSGCPNNMLLPYYTSVLLQWASKNGFLGPVSEQGILEVDWKIVTISSGYAKMKSYLTAPVRSTIEAWIGKLHATTSKRAADANNNHLIWHINALVWSSMATGKLTEAAAEVDKIMQHMVKYITADGVIMTEGRCQKTLHYHAFYMEAVLGTLIGYKYHTGNMPKAWPTVAKRVAEVMANINNPALGTSRAVKAFSYTGSLKSCSKINPADKTMVPRVNALYQAVISANGVLAPCQADSSYFGNFRFMPFMWAGAKNPPLGSVCCAPK